jgi:5-methylcytosine-specific restriction endonuclease McrA
LRPECKNCIAAYNKRYRETHKEEVQAEKREWYLANKKAIIEKIALWRIQNPEKRKKQDRKYREVHSESERERHRKYDAEYPEKKRMRMLARRYKKKTNGGSLSPKEWQEVLNKYGNKCLGCGATGVKLEVDHVIPIKLGGRHAADNVQPLCRSCNAHKSAHTIDYRPF